MLEILSWGRIATDPNATRIWGIEGLIPEHNTHLPQWVAARRASTRKPWVAGNGGTAVPSHSGAEAASRVSGAEQEHRHCPLSLNWGMFYPVGQLAYGCRHPVNENLIHSRMPHDSKGKCINENTNSEQKVVINVQCTCAASLIMLPGNRGRGGRGSPGASGSLWVLFKSGVLPRGEREPHWQLSPPYWPPFTDVHACIHAYLHFFWGCKMPSWINKYMRFLFSSRTRHSCFAVRCLQRALNSSMFQWGKFLHPVPLIMIAWWEGSRLSSFL